MKYQSDLNQSKVQKKAFEAVIRKLRKKRPKEVDQLFHDLHDETFKKIDCLECANCCKTTSPIFRDIDIERLSKHLRMPVQSFQSTYLMMDSDRDWVLKSSPCPFLGADNYCSVYDHRPKACSEYPHTDRKNMTGILDLSLKNTLVCPAVSRIFTAIDSQLTRKEK